MESNKTVTIGIPAFNEENNISLLLKSLMHQRQAGWKLDKILVVSDGSTDKTNRIVSKFKTHKIHLIALKKRGGQAHAQNVIIRQTFTDILVLLNADIEIVNTDFITKLIHPIISNSAGLTSIRTRPSNPNESLITKILSSSIQFKERIFEQWNNGVNIYTCVGRARALSKRLYKQLEFKNSVGEDAFSYIFAKRKNIPYIYVKNSFILYKLPTTLKDHISQSVRFLHSQNYSKYNEKYEYIIPFKLLIPNVFRSILKNPYLLLYGPLIAATTIISFVIPTTSNKWQVAHTSK